MKRVFFYGILLTAITAGFTSCEKETYETSDNTMQHAKSGEDDEYADILRGNVTNTNNVAIDNATITLNYQNNVYATTTTNQSGYYEFTQIPFGQYVLKAEKAGYQTQTTLIIVAIDGQEIVHDFRLVAE